MYNRLGAYAHVHVHVHVHVHDETSQVKSVWLKREVHVSVCNRSLGVSRLSGYKRETFAGAAAGMLSHTRGGRIFRACISRTYVLIVGFVLIVCIDGLLVCVVARGESIVMSVAPVDCVGRERRSRSSVEGFGRGRC